MHRLRGVFRDYAWGSRDAIPCALGLPLPEDVIAEWWLGAHTTGPCGVSPVGEYDDSPHADLSEMISADPVALLGTGIMDRFGKQLPFLMKLIAPARTLSLQVHPTRDHARTMFQQEDMIGIPRDAPHRNYRDQNHKPELIVALTEFEALSGFRSPGEILRSLIGLDAAVAYRVRHILQHDPSATGVRRAFHMYLEGSRAPSAAELDELTSACALRLKENGSDSPMDSTVVRLSQDHPGDSGIVAGLLLNSVTLSPGEALYIPPGCVHAYMRGLGIEIMASSDNTIRAGLTGKHVDVSELLQIVDYEPCPPQLVEPHVHDHTAMFRVPVEDFQLSLTRIEETQSRRIRMPETGPRIILCLDGEFEIHSAGESATVSRGDAMFASAKEPALHLSGAGFVVVASTPAMH